MRSGTINKLFVYGTLLQGERRNGFLKDWKLVDVLEIPGTLYNTGFGYPAADFCDNRGTLLGELYEYENNDLAERLIDLDEIEGVKENLFIRIKLVSSHHKFYAYEIAPSLKKLTSSFNIIHCGNWRQSGSVLLDDLSLFAINFEFAQSGRYELFPRDNCREFVYLKGDLPILVVSHHATSHRRKGKIKSHEKYTGAINVILNSMTGAHSVYTVYASEYDSNYCKSTSLKESIKELVHKYDIKFVLDIHGTGSYRKFDLYPGIGKFGEFIYRNGFFLSELEKVLYNHNIRIGGTEVFPAYRQNTVSRFVRTELKIPSMQIEINKKFREPEKDSYSFGNMIKSLREYINNVAKWI